MPIINEIWSGYIQLAEDKVHGRQDVKLEKNCDTGGSKYNEIQQNC